MITYSIIIKSFYGDLKTIKKTFNDENHKKNWWAMMNRKGIKIMDVFKID